MKIISIVAVWCFGLAALGAENETAFDIAPDLRELERVNPHGHRVLRDGTYDTMDQDAKIAFVAKLAVDASVGDPLVAGVAAGVIDKFQSARDSMPEGAARQVFDESVDRAMLELIGALDVALDAVFQGGESPPLRKTVNEESH